MQNYHLRLQTETDKWDGITGSHQMLIGAMHAIIYDYNNNGDCNWDNYKLHHQVVQFFLGDKTPAWLLSDKRSYSCNDRKDRQIMALVKLVNDFLGVN